jgi:hypothetical protein
MLRRKHIAVEARPEGLSEVILQAFDDVIEVVEQLRPGPKTTVRPRARRNMCIRKPFDCVL